jgi:ubiquinone/menaquinone biosynthesis C-methylase UbiE
MLRTSETRTQATENKQYAAAAAESPRNIRVNPGGEALTIKAAKKANLPEGAAILDMGCGEGDTAALLARDFGFEATGIDASYKLIEKGKKKYPDLDLRRMEAEHLEFESRSFDAVFMECSLSVMRIQEDAAFEAYCVLKPGGKLIITDLYIRDPEPAAVAAMLAKAKEKTARPRVEGDCGENTRPSFVMLDGAFVVDELAAMLEELGFELEYFENVSDVLMEFAAQVFMEHGSLAAYFESVVPEGEDPAAYYACAAFGDGTKCPKKLGYFLMILKKR